VTTRPGFLPEGKPASRSGAIAGDVFRGNPRPMPQPQTGVRSAVAYGRTLARGAQGSHPRATRTKTGSHTEPAPRSEDIAGGAPGAIRGKARLHALPHPEQVADSRRSNACAPSHASARLRAHDLPVFPELYMAVSPPHAELVSASTAKPAIRRTSFVTKNRGMMQINTGTSQLL